MRPVQAFWIIFLSALFLSTSAYGAPSARVVVGTDRLFFARPGAGPKLVSAIKKSAQEIPQGSALVNYSTQSAEVELPGGHIMTLGPNTAVELTRIEESAPLIITFSHGLLRLRLLPRLKATFPALVLSQNAIVGARSGEFMVMGPKNHSLTSVLTLEGALHFVATDHKEFTSSELTIERESNDYRNDSNRFIPQLAQDKREIKSLDERAAYKLTQDESVVVERGQYSVTLKKFERVSAPAAINPMQFHLLSLNKNLILKSRMNEMIHLNPAHKKGLKMISPPVVPAGGAQGQYSAKNGIFRPKSGGLIELGTGLYSAPARDAGFDNEARTYLPAPEFALDAASGQLIPPSGLVLDPALGFSPKLGTNESLHRRVRDSLNLGPVLGLKDERGVEISSVAVALSKSELSNRQRLEFSVGLRQETFESTGAASQGELESERALAFELEWRSESYKRWGAHVNVSYTKLEYAQGRADGLFRLGLGAQYLLTSRLALPVGLRYDQRHFEGERVTLPQFYTGAEAILFEAFKGKLSWRAQGLALLNLEKEQAPLTIDSGLAFKFKTGPMWWHKEKTGLGIYYEVESRSGGISDTEGSRDQEDKRQVVGLTLAHVF